MTHTAARGLAADVRKRVPLGLVTVVREGKTGYSVQVILGSTVYELHTVAAALFFVGKYES